MNGKRYIVEGGKTLHGQLFVQGSKNETLAFLATAIVFRLKIKFIDVPEISDVLNFLTLGKPLGLEYEYKKGKLFLNATKIHSGKIDLNDLKKLRASIYYLPILAGLNTPFEFGNPGGCSLGKRPIDFHLDIMKAFGLDYEEVDSGYEFTRIEYKATTVFLPFPSFGATVNSILMGCLCQGTTTIVNAAQEPEIIHLIEFIKQGGIDITQVGSTIVIAGKKVYQGAVEYRISPDRIVAATYISLGVLTADYLEIHHCPSDDLHDFLDFLNYGEILLDHRKNYIGVTSQSYDEKISICANPYPGFSTDILPIVVPILAVGRGMGFIKDRVYKDRFGYLEELQKFNLDIKLIEGDFVILGTDQLRPAMVKVTDLRGGMSELLLALRIKGRSVIENVDVLNRGYENLFANLKSIGADIYEEE